MGEGGPGPHLPETTQILCPVLPRGLQSQCLCLRGRSDLQCVIYPPISPVPALVFTGFPGLLPEHQDGSKDTKHLIGF